MGYHRTMRRVVFIMMIALIPFRGWLGEAMATQMASELVHQTQTQITINNIAPQAINTPHTAENHHNMVASKPACAMHHASADTDSQTPAKKATCDNCQACHANGLVAHMPRIAHIATQHGAPVSPHIIYASATPTRAQKPPLL
ncbi:MAG TPA: hypothetical protein PKC80_10840 [Burkholderiaceae bacterium]|nr:hypothetical protein [Burkholderiaceae bacterium]